MPKTLVIIPELVESDFREIQKLLIRKFGIEYTVGYIRKVCKGKRHNTTIIAMAEDFLKIKKEMQSKIDGLSK